MLEGQQQTPKKNIAATTPRQRWQLWSSKYKSANIFLLRVVRTKPLRWTTKQAAWPKVPYQTITLNNKTGGVTEGREQTKLTI